MKINQLVLALEFEAKRLSEAKVKLLNVLSTNGLKLAAKDGKKFDDAINNVNKVVVDVFSKIEYKVPYVNYSNERPLFSGPISLRKGHSVDSEVSFCVGLINLSLSKIEALSAEVQVLNPNKMIQVKLEDSYKVAIEKAIKSIKVASSATDAIIVVETEEEKADKIAAEEAAADKVEADKIAAEKVISDKVAAEKVATDKVAADKVAAEKVTAEK